MFEEIALTGGRITQGVVRRGDHVLRPCCPNAAFAHAVLRWLEGKGVDAAPRYIGLAEDGREITSFLEGVAPGDLGHFDDAQLAKAGSIMKELHAALADFPGCLAGQTVCHNDLSPCNFMFRDGLPYAVFDWDAAGIGDPLGDLAYAAWMWCDIGNPDNSAADVGRMIKIMLDSYGLREESRSLLIAKIHEQIRRVETSMSDFLTASQQHEKRAAFRQWTGACDRWLYEHQDQIVPYFAPAL